MSSSPTLPFHLLGLFKVIKHLGEYEDEDSKKKIKLLFADKKMNGLSSPYSLPCLIVTVCVCVMLLSAAL